MTVSSDAEHFMPRKREQGQMESLVRGAPEGAETDYGATSINASGGTGTPNAKDRRIAMAATKTAPATNLKSVASGA
jgi:hypothetical protein